MKIFAFLLTISFFSFIQFDKPAYLLYDKDLKTTSYEKMLKELSQADIVFFGELHDNSLNHWLDLQVT